MPMDPQATLARVDGLLARRAPLDAAACLWLAEAVPMVPGRARAIARKLALQNDAASVPGLLAMPRGIAGVVEGIVRAIRTGVARRRIDGTFAPRGLVVTFPRSRARRFGPLLARAAIAFGSRLEVLEVDRRIVYRAGVQEGAGTLAGAVATVAQDLATIVPEALALEGSRLWVHGFPIARGRADRAPARHYVEAFVRYAASCTEPRRSPPP